MGVGAEIGQGVAQVAAPIAGSIIQNIGSARQARRAQEFTERMRNTAHQAEVKDLIAAGLNPILSAGGSGASSPEGVFYQPENIFRTTGDDIKRAIETVPERKSKLASAYLSSALKTQAEQQTTNLQATTDLIKAQKTREISAADVNSATAAKIRAETPEKQVRSGIANTIQMGIAAMKKAVERTASSAGEAWVNFQRSGAEFQKRTEKLSTEMERQGYEWRAGEWHKKRP